MTGNSQQSGDEIRAGDKVAHRYRPGRVGHVMEVLSRGASSWPPGIDSEIDRVAWVQWEGHTGRVTEPLSNLIKWA